MPIPIFFGMVGGARAFGFIGVFIGPTLLAVGCRIIQEWASAPFKFQAAKASGPLTAP